MTDQIHDFRQRGMRTRIRYFFYGTLLDVDVQEIVFGRRLLQRQMIPAVTHGYRRVYVKGAWYPTMAEASDQIINGMIITGLTHEERGKVDWFEDDDYELRPIPISIHGKNAGTALAYMPPDGSNVSHQAWTMREWRQRFKRPFLNRARRWMVSNFDPGW